METALHFAAPAVVSSATRPSLRAAGRARPRRARGASVVAKLEGGLGKGVPTTNYVVPLDKATGMTRPLVEILRDLNKRVPDKIIDPDTNTVPWYHANRMLSFYAPGEINLLLFSSQFQEFPSVVGSNLRHTEMPREQLKCMKAAGKTVAEAEEAAFCKACARFGFGLYLYHDDTHRDEYSFH
ncbi:hypothetical protein PR202_ga15299 [Eleusine coracana subsp. coracana]|uniref:Uncharacterized protein n=1 Tax=Eleusine coracana subsp. coracana TaxID=191504 RepID=A0AAV5CJU6_ELECO|nr:hypothetical protein PR202_ga15299 [Eleusine coracana subsp. coracana]